MPLSSTRRGADAQRKHRRHKDFAHQAINQASALLGDRKFPAAGVTWTLGRRCDDGICRPRATEAAAHSIAAASFDPAAPKLAATRSFTGG